MKKLLWILWVFFYCIAQAHGGQWRFPGEFEKQDAVWVGWLSKTYLKGYPTDEVMLDIVKNLVDPDLGDMNVEICVPDPLSWDHVKEILKNAKVATNRISPIIIPFTVPYWRDFGPIFIKNDGTQEMKIVDFSFNMWGYYPLSDLQSRYHEKIDRKVAALMNLPSLMSRVVSEGGDRLLNGQGTMIAVEACEFQRNPNMSREALEAEYKRLLGVNKIIWLPRGTVEDDRFDTSVLPGPGPNEVAYRSGSANNHGDEFCRFIDARTILLAEVSKEEAAKNSIAAENRHRMETNFKILNTATDQNGDRFEIVRIPMPEILYFKADPTDEVYLFLLSAAKYTDGTCFPIGEPIWVVPATSYCNFLISNNVVLAQQYYEQGMPPSVRAKDQAALTILEKQFPLRRVIPIKTTGLNFGGGGIHCATQQQPSIKRKN
ncbi:MAG: agmatine deiminase family protein [Proteobacteria bacterium]|nr:agmatine deiminase family protein [Pseudomonadota bacterium]